MVLTFFQRRQLSARQGMLGLQTAEPPVFNVAA